MARWLGASDHNSLCLVHCHALVWGILGWFNNALISPALDLVCVYDSFSNFGHRADALCQSAAFICSDRTIRIEYDNFDFWDPLADFGLSLLYISLHCNVVRCLEAPRAIEKDYRGIKLEGAPAPG